MATSDDTPTDQTAHVTLSHKWAKVPEELLYDPAITDSAKVVFAILHRHGEDPANCFPSHARIAGFMGRSKRSVQAWIKELVDAGWVDIIRRKTLNGDPDSNAYHVHMVRAPQREVRADERVPLRAGERGGSTLDNAPKESNGTRASSNEKHIGLALVDNTPPPAARGESHDLPFETFWNAYPRQVEKPKTRQAWTRAIRRAPDHVIIDGARRFAHDPNRQDCYTPYPAKWLDGDCWNDPPIPNRNPAPKEPKGFAGIRAGLKARGL